MNQYFIVAATESMNTGIQLQSMSGAKDKRAGEPVSLVINQNPLEYIAGEQASATITANPIQVEPPLVLQPNVGNILTYVANGLFVLSFMKMMVQDSSLRKAQDGVALKHMRQVKENHKKNEIRIEKDKMKKVS